MNNESLTQLLKNNLDEMKANSIDPYLSKDPEYQQAVQNQMLAEDAYQRLILTEEQKSVIDNLLHCIDTSSMEYSSLSYLAGLFDRHTISSLHLTAENTSPPKQVLNDFYHGNFIPAELPYETPETLSSWKQLFELENNFKSDLTDDQKQVLSQLLQQRDICVAHNAGDSFKLGFSLGARFLIDIFH